MAGTNHPAVTGTMILILCAAAATAFGQNQTVRQDEVYSRILHEKRPLQIILPKGFDPRASEKYDVLYVLDGAPDFLQSECGLLASEGFIPKNLIIVGIPNTRHDGVDMRNRDFTPTKVDAVSGGAGRFLLFFKQELLPYIKSKYPVKDTGHTLYGGSLGGLFVVYVFLTEPDLFTSYVAVDPSLWWDHFRLNHLAEANLANAIHLQNTLFIAGRAGEPFKEMGIDGMQTALKARAPSGLQWTCVSYTNETHYSTLVKGLWDGMKFSYGGFYASTGGYYFSRNIDMRPMNATALREKPFHLVCYNLMADAYVHYTTDGSEPTRQSPTLKYDTELRFSKDAKIRFKSIGVREEYDRTAVTEVRVVDAFSPVELPSDAKAGGLRYMRYKGEWTTPPATDDLKPDQTGVAENGVNVFGEINNEAVLCVLTGYLQIIEGGNYIFSMGNGDDDSKVFVANQLILGPHFKSGLGENYLVPLQKGFYPIRIEYFRKGHSAALVPIYLQPENGEAYPLPSERLYAVR